MTRARFAVAINNTLMDSSFNNIRIFGNGYMCAYFGKGEVENVTFSNIRYDNNVNPHKDDEHIYVEWNQTRVDGYNCVYFNGTNVKNLDFNNLHTNGNIPVVFGGYGSGEIECENIKAEGLVLSQMQGINVLDKSK